MQKVLIIGSPGAGKSCFARCLRDITGLPLYYLDLIWHKSDKTNITQDEFDSILKEILKKDKWIIDGNYNRTLEMRLKECDTVFFLDYPVDVCLSGAESRIGIKREEMPWVEEEFDPEFRQWILDFPKNKLPIIYLLLEKYKEKINIITFKSRDEAEKYFTLLKC